MHSNLVNQLGGVVLGGIIATAFFRAYREPTRDKLTRLLYRYVEATSPPWIKEPRIALLINTVICAAVALMCAAFAIVELLRLR